MYAGNKYIYTQYLGTESESNCVEQINVSSDGKYSPL